ncbi:MAG: hypothetical protein WKF71_11505 [Pyrinomonadaceae bacterium]
MVNFISQNMHRQIPQINRIRILADVGNATQNLHVAVKSLLSSASSRNPPPRYSIVNPMVSSHDCCRSSSKTKAGTKQQDARQTDEKFVFSRNSLSDRPAKIPEIRKKNAEEKRINPQMRLLDIYVVTERQISRRDKAQQQGKRPQSKRKVFGIKANEFLSDSLAEN